MSRSRSTTKRPFCALVGRCSADTTSACSERNTRNSAGPALAAARTHRSTLCFHGGCAGGFDTDAVPAVVTFMAADTTRVRFREKGIALPNRRLKLHYPQSVAQKGDGEHDEVLLRRLAIACAAPAIASLL